MESISKILIKDLYLAELINFRSDVHNLDLAEFGIEKHTSSELKELFPNEKQLFEGGYFIVIRNNYEIEVERNKQNRYIDFPAFYIFMGHELFYKPLIILNLFKESRDPLIFGQCYFKRFDTSKNSSMWYKIGPVFKFDRILYADEDGNPVPSIGYELSVDDVNNLQGFVKAISFYITKEEYNKHEKFIQIAINFYDEGIKKELDSGLEDMRIIDYMIALEALYLQREPEMTYKFSNRLAILLGESEEEKQQLNEYARKLYRLRSNLVHGSSTKEEIDRELFCLECGQDPKTLEFQGLRCNVRELVRRSILYFLSLYTNGYKKEDILRMLDNAIFDKEIEDKINFAKKKFVFS